MEERIMTAFTEEPMRNLMVQAEEVMEG